jgi:uncharacterized lipoprotein YmbA
MGRPETLMVTSRIFRLALLCAAALVAACASRAPPPSYYLLQATAQAVPAAAPAETAGPAVGVGPIRFPRYLDRPQMVVALPDGELRLRDGERWADNLRENFARVFAEDLAIKLPAERILVHPWARSESVDFKLALRVNEFHLSEDGRALLDVRWNAERTALRTLTTMSEVELRRRLASAKGRGGLPVEAVEAAL